ncbi:universal stress protein [Caballeronia humi]|uniref:UspA domain-containing protein n=1 Tax=Caballeronia humi TaxID=326474 RepID=A0A158IMD1_9BURK|nr:universal stress protein [Caballeronia humi]SAL57744.1 UspA domain-containing protein [Caballeronia humi]
MYRKILVAFDGSEASERAVTEAIGLAANSQARVWVTFVLDKSKAYSYPVTHRDELIKAGARMLDGARTRSLQAGVPCHTKLVETDNIHETIAVRLERCAQLLEVDLVVMGTSGRSGWRRMAFGSVAEEFVRIARWPVLLIRADPQAGGSGVSAFQSTPAEGATELAHQDPFRAGIRCDELHHRHCSR